VLNDEITQTKVLENEGLKATKVGGEQDTRDTEKELSILESEEMGGEELTGGKHRGKIREATNASSTVKGGGGCRRGWGASRCQTTDMEGKQEKKKTS